MNIGGIQRLSLCDYPNTPAAVIFLQGCNLRCPYCHNKSLLSMKKTATHTTESVLNFLTKRKGKLSGVVISGGEPTMQPDLLSFIMLIKTQGFKVKLDTNGTDPRQVQEVISKRLVDYIAMDIKATWPKYDLLSGKAVQTDRIHQSINIISKSGIAHHFRTTFFQQLLNRQDLAEIKSYLPSSSQFIVQKHKPPPIKQI